MVGRPGMMHRANGLVMDRNRGPTDCHRGWRVDGMTYFTNIGPKNGPFLWRDARGAAIGVLEAPDNHSPIGMALPFGWTKDGVARWRLSVRGAQVPGLFIVVDRQFRPAQ